MDKNINLTWVEKYRPKTLNEIISHNNILNTLNNLINNNKLPHLILYGPPGTGKTTTILACAKQIYGENYKSIILELNGSDERGISVVREHIKDFSNTHIMLSQIMNINCKYKLVILDEADSMTIDAQFALRRIIEKFSGNTRFILICNYINNKRNGEFKSYYINGELYFICNYIYYREINLNLLKFTLISTLTMIFYIILRKYILIAHGYENQININSWINRIGNFNLELYFDYLNVINEGFCEPVKTLKK
jgi:GTPase SAR1 family protein